jgi:DNA helicase II / ATP-dependent DNA helicase PcrA
VPSASRVILAAAGGGKTTRIVEQALTESGVRSVLLTYTRDNAAELERKLYERSPAIPAYVEHATWFSFLLRELARPYRPKLHTHRIDGIAWVKGRSVPYVPASDVGRHYFADNRLVYSDKIAKFVCECDKESGGAVLRRLAQRFDHIYVDEVQDMAGYDFELLERMLRGGIQLTLIGDHRQATYSTNNAKKNAGYAGSDIALKFLEWKKYGLVSLTYETHTYRCHPDIARLADSLYPGEPATQSRNTVTTGHDGVFLVRTADMAQYIQAYAPQVLRLSKKTKSPDPSARNFGESKGLTFDRVLILPHGLATKWLSSGDITPIMRSLAKMYVGITRARHSVAFVCDGAVGIAGTTWNP